MVVAKGLRELTVGRIVYCVFTAIPLAVLFQLVFDPGQTKDDRFRDFLLGWLLIFLDVPIVLIGTGILVRQRYQRNPLRFWLIAVFVSAIPILFILTSVLLESVAGIRFQPFI